MVSPKILKVEADNVTLEKVNNTFRVKDGGITNAKIADGTIDLTTKCTYVPVNKAGDTITGNLTVGDGSSQKLVINSTSDRQLTLAYPGYNSQYIRNYQGTVYWYHETPSASPMSSIDSSGNWHFAGNLVLNAGKTVDGVDISEHKHTGASGDAPKIPTDGLEDGAVTPAKLSTDIIKTLQTSNTLLVSSDTFTELVSLTVEANYYSRFYMVIFAVTPPTASVPASISIDSMISLCFKKDGSDLAYGKAWNQTDDTYGFFSGQTYIHLETDVSSQHTFAIDVASGPYSGKDAKVKGEIKVVGI